MPTLIVRVFSFSRYKPHINGPRFNMSTNSIVRYVALLAFNRIVISHPHLVALQQNVIMDCLDDPDISIRLQALDLAVQMATSETLQDIVNRLVRQLLNSQKLDPQGSDAVGNFGNNGDWQSQEIADSMYATVGNQAQLNLPADYKTEVVVRILDICSRDNYSDIVDFEWYVDVLAQLLKLLPQLNVGRHSQGDEFSNNNPDTSISFKIGTELRSVAVRVKAVREKATRAAESFLFLVDNLQMHNTVLTAYVGALGSVAWIVGEFSQLLAFPDRNLNILTNPNNESLPGTVLTLYLQAVPKVFSRLISSEREWSASSYTQYSIMLARLITFLEGLGAHPDLDVQERATEFLELLRLAKEALQPQPTDDHQLPFLLAEVIPGLFRGLDLNSVAIDAQKRVPLPENLDLHESITHILPKSMDDAYDIWVEAEAYSDAKNFYFISNNTSAIQRDLSLDMQLDATNMENVDSVIGKIAKIPEQQRLGRRERNRDDPFYIGYNEEFPTTTHTYQDHDTSNKEELDIDSIPIVELTSLAEPSSSLGGNRNAETRTRPSRFQIAADETLDFNGSLSTEPANQKADSSNNVGRSLLQVDSSGIERLALSEEHQKQLNNLQSIQKEEDQELEMVEAMRKIERVRLEMQRASERVDTQGLPSDGQLIKRKAVKKKKKKKVRTEEEPGGRTKSSE
jgi:AP-3 complex subunit delta